MTHPVSSCTNAGVSPIWPGQPDAVRGSCANVVTCPSACTSTTEVPAPNRPPRLAPLSTNTSPAVRDPAVVATGQIPDGTVSPSEGEVEPTIVTVSLPARNEPASGASTCAACRSSFVDGRWRKRGPVAA